MATHESALKRYRQNIKKTAVNQAHRTRVRNLVKAVLEAVEENDRELALSSLKAAVPAIQKAVSKGVLHANTASRKISRLTQKVNALASVSADADARGKPGRPSGSRA